MKEPAMRTVWEGSAGKADLRVVEVSMGFQGIAIRNGKAVARVSGTTVEDTIEKLRSALASEHPDYVGFEGAKAKFLQIFPQGFETPAFLARERDYKLKAKAKLDASIAVDSPLGETDEAKPLAALRSFQATNMLSPFEKTRLGACLRSQDGHAFLRGAALFADGEIAVGLATMEAALRPHEAAKWTSTTYLPFLWRPDTHMFLKPEVTVSFATQVGHHFCFDYTPALETDVYASLLDLVTTTENAIADLVPRDRIDVQSFIWVVGKYSVAAESARKDNSATTVKSNVD